MPLRTRSPGLSGWEICWILSGDLVDLVGIEPTTSSMPFLIFDYSGATRAKREWQRGAVFMRVRRIFAALHLYPSDSDLQRPRRAGMRGLRHMSRHKTVRPELESRHVRGNPPPLRSSAPLAKSTSGEFAFASPYKIPGVFLSVTLSHGPSSGLPWPSDSSKPLPKLGCPGQLSMSVIA